ncbi:Proline--tRNA ligase [Dictyocoela muelleri]|nr:Proline--tRNA ligase [Dictyocoela muelleri]
MTDQKVNQKFGITIKKSKNFSEWYQQVITKSELLDYYEISGCYILRPSCMFIWNTIRNFFTAEIEKIGVLECSFPMLVRKCAIEKEKAHINNFEPELAWITKCGNSDVEPVALRPTSESIMYPSYAKWLRSHRDLPLKYNQWCNVVRWEVKSTTPLIRGREFLWQEGHTAHLRLGDAENEVLEILNLYEKVYEELLAVPVIKGRKTENEKFGGAEYTLTTEAFIPDNGRAVQGATSHCLGNNFSKMYEIKVTDVDENDIYVFQNSWGLTTRSIGVAVMVHSDDQGLVLPPRVAMIQAVLIPCGIEGKFNNPDIIAYIEQIYNELKDNGIRVYLDDRKNVSPGYKFNHWEIRGVPLRLEIGPRDFKNSEVTLVYRHNFKKVKIPRLNISAMIRNELDEIQSELFQKAKAERDSKIKKVANWNDFMKQLNKKNMILAKWCGNSECELLIRKKSEVVCDGEILMGAKSLCIPFENSGDYISIGDKCVNCENDAICWCLFGRSY